jgi:conjugative transfer signal peptidase TraF
MNRTSVPFEELPLKARARVFFKGARAHAKKYCALWLGIPLVVLLASHSYGVQVNITESLPQRLFLIEKKNFTLAKGDYVAFYTLRDATGGYRLPFIKQVRCTPGDTVTSHLGSVFCNGELIAEAKTHSLKGEPLKATDSYVLKPGEWFVTGFHKDSLDSRYAMFGPVSENQVIGRATPLL